MIFILVILWVISMLIENYILNSSLENRSPGYLDPSIKTDKRLWILLVLTSPLSLIMEFLCEAFK